MLLRPYSALQKNLFKWAMMVLLYLVAKRFGFVEVLRDGVVSLLNML